MPGRTDGIRADCKSPDEKGRWLEMRYQWCAPVRGFVSQPSWQFECVHSLCVSSAHLRFSMSDPLNTLFLWDAVPGTRTKSLTVSG